MLLRRLGLLALCLLGFAREAGAQAAPTIISQWTSGSQGQFNVQWSNPNTASEKQIACSPVSGDRCFVLNQAACSAEPIPLVFTATSMTGPIANSGTTSQNIYVWGLLNNTCSTGYAPNSPTTDTNTNEVLGIASNLSSTFLNVGGQGFTFPGNVQYSGGLDPNGQPGTAEPLLYTHLDLMNQYGACNEGGAVNLSTFSLCIGVDANGSGCVGSACGTTSTTTTTTTGTTTSNGDYIAWAQVQIDTLPPQAPTISSPKPLNGRVKFTVDYDATSLDTYNIIVYSSSDPTNVALANAFDASDPNNTGCAAWAGSFERTSIGVQPQTGTLSQIINGTNGVTYAYCAQAIDYMHNPSFLSAPAVLTPQFECDLFDCYPGELQTGFCGAAMGPAWAITPLWMAARALKRRRRKTTP